MTLDRRPQNESARAAAPQSTPAPGEHTLTEGIAVQHQPSTASAERATTGTEASAPAISGGPASSGSRPTLQMLFGGPPAATADPSQVHATAARHGVIQFAGGVGQADDPYERHADAVADAVVQGASAEPLLDQMARGGGAPVVQRKIGEPSNVIFGLSGRSQEAIQAAVDAGYHTFDGADTYGNTIELLAAALKKAAKRRDEFEVIYKVDHTAPDALDGHLQAVAALLGGYIDHVLVHKATDTHLARAYLPTLLRLKSANVIRNVGAGDVKAGMDDHLQHGDSFEVDASDLFLAGDAQPLIERLNQAKKPVFVYNIMATLKKLLGLAPDARPSRPQLNAMVSAIRNKLPTAEPILSSGQAATVQANLEIDEMDDYTETDYRDGAQAYAKIEEGPKQELAVVTFQDMAGDVKDHVMSFLFSYQWDAESMFTDSQDYTKQRDAKLALFKDEDLDVHYASDGASAHTLRALIHMLFDSTGNCHRVEAANLLQQIL